ncbi:MAG: DNA repair protein rad50 [Candelina submexicana]|nr:MAG: DNA repair protein rad50 [Candelina submexicana]
MSKIDRLSILGIRSFDNTRSETIQFHTPLTLIVGYNGSGKTTIIECLKYATTGALPPNAGNGSAFIHDPNLCGEKEVLAQVKMSFKSTSGARMVATRSLQLTVKKTIRAFKTLEGHLLMVKDGERTGISSRVAELNQLMPQYLGVSRAILDNVIFCHQDDSLWPMAEPANLKRKFDEIFEALKYTKAIDNIKVLRKHQNAELAKFKIDEQHSKEDKDKADRAEKRSRELSDEIEALREETHKLGEDIRQATEEADKAWSHAARFEEIIGTLKGKQIEAQTKEESINYLRSHVKEMEESDEWLKDTLDQYEERMALHQEHIATQTGQYDALKVAIETNRQQSAQKQTEAGRLAAEKTNHEQQVVRREAMVKETARRHNIRGFDTELDEAHIRDFMERLTKMSRDQNLKLERAQRETQEELQTAQHTLNELGERRSALNQSKAFAKDQITTNDRIISRLQAELDKIDIDEGAKAALDSKLDDVKSKLQKAKKDIQEANFDKSIHEANTRLRSLEESSEELNSELIQSSRRLGDLAKLDFLRNELRERQHSLETMKGAHNDRIAEVVGTNWQPSNLDREFQLAVDQKHSELLDAERQRNGVSRDLEQVEFKLNTSRLELKKKRQESQTCEKRLREVSGTEPSEYLETVARLQDDRDTLKNDVANFAKLQEYYESCVKIAEEHNVCRLCERSFKAEKERAKLLAKIDKLLSKAAQESDVKELELIEADLKEARDAAPSYDTWQRLTISEIPNLEAEGRRLEARRDTLLIQAEEQDKSVNEREEAKRDVGALTKTIQNITRYSSEIKSLESQIENLAAQQKETSMSRTLDDIKEQLSDTKAKVQTARNTVVRLTGDYERAKGLINSLELESRDVSTRLQRASHELEQKGNLDARTEELRSLNQHQRDSMKRADRDIEALAPHFLKAQGKYDEIKRRGAEKVSQHQHDASELVNSSHQLKLTDEDINSYLARGGPAQLARCEREMKSLQNELSKLEGEQRQITIEVNKARGQLDKQDATKRSIQDNLKLRQDIRGLETVNAEIAELEAHNAETDRDRFTREAEKWGLRHRNASAEQSSKMGAMKSKDDQLLQLLTDYETDYKDAAKKYKEAHIKVETTKAAVEDLGRYGGALDKAIMRYHSLKMEEINRIVEELWKKTYQGTDVDTVMIRSDTDGAKGKSSYNYRVTMVKQDAEMDMRGRCSAGQKVLASIIIRLALAECFGVNCGLIALDEPTTNLDRDNIKSLAESLHDIINVRQQQSNFQLIVITHDEEFLRYMKCADFCDNYYRVSRNERQKSIIERQSIAEVSG